MSFDLHKIWGISGDTRGWPERYFGTYEQAAQYIKDNDLKFAFAGIDYTKKMEYLDYLKHRP